MIRVKKGVYTASYKRELCITFKSLKKMPATIAMVSFSERPFDERLVRDPLHPCYRTLVFPLSPSPPSNGSALHSLRALDNE
ncbi:hypothetical protein TNCV_1048321 [Trichonephila clavipes]|nr:hypothetical protein TNCV_1048321 [Trichonephila clavipes]